MAGLAKLPECSAPKLMGNRNTETGLRSVDEKTMQEAFGTAMFKEIATTAGLTFDVPWQFRCAPLPSMGPEAAQKRKARGGHNPNGNWAPGFAMPCLLPDSLEIAALPRTVVHFVKEGKLMRRRENTGKTGALQSLEKEEVVLPVAPRGANAAATGPGAFGATGFRRAGFPHYFHGGLHSPLRFPHAPLSAPQDLMHNIFEGIGKHEMAALASTNCSCNRCG